MPTSNLLQVVKLVELILLLKPNSILDVGVGFGKYGLLLREYLELWDGRNVYNQWKRRIDGVEVFAEYLTPVHDYIYDHIYLGDALEIVPTIQERYDLILLVDIIEHFSLEDGLRLIKFTRKCGRNVLISTPKLMATQSDVFGNPYETHRSQWKKSDFRGFENIFFVGDRQSLIVWIGDFAGALREARLNRILGKCFPFLVQPIRTVKSLLGCYASRRS
jgi:hypothetical protein